MIPILFVLNSGLNWLCDTNWVDSWLIFGSKNSTDPISIRTFCAPLRHEAAVITKSFDIKEPPQYLKCVEPVVVMWSDTCQGNWYWCAIDPSIIRVNGDAWVFFLFRFSYLDNNKNWSSDIPLRCLRLMFAIKLLKSLCFWSFFFMSLLNAVTYWIDNFNTCLSLIYPMYRKYHFRL